MAAPVEFGEMALASKFVAALVAVGIAWQAAHLAWLAFGPAPAAGAVAQLETLPAPQSGDVGIDAQRIADAHLFGSSRDEASDVDPNSLPKSQVSLVVTGTIALKDPQAGFALVGESAGAARLHRAGAPIDTLARLHSVYRDRVVIDRGGTLETLLLRRLALEVPGMAVTKPAPPRESVTQSAQVVTEKLEEVKRLTSNPNPLDEAMRSQPVFANGSLKGFRVYPRGDRAAFTRAGLQSGDLVTAINGTPMNSSSQSNAVLSQLTGSNVANVTISRYGQELQLTLNLSQLASAD